MNVAAMHGNLVIVVVVLLMAEKSVNGAGDTLTKGESLTGSQTLTSKGGTFELGFFHTSTDRFYLSIRYTQIEPKPLVWVANRDKPLPDATAANLQIASNGDLQLHYGRDLFWSTSTSAESVAAVLSDDGNLIVRDESRPEKKKLWQSFDQPTHAWLPGATLGGARRLVSWKSDEDPSAGMFSAEMSSESKVVLKWNESAVYWESESYEPGNQFGFDAQQLNSLSIRFEVEKQYVRLENTLAIMINDTFRLDFSMLVMDHREGRLKRVPSRGSSGGGAWASPSSLPAERFCGTYGVLTTTHSCGCLPRFRPSSTPNPMGDSCNRNTLLPDCNGKGGKVGFMEISDIIKWPNQPKLITEADTDKECELTCRRSCNCTAYAFDPTGCLVWEGDLYGIRRGISENRKLHVKLASSELAESGSKSKTLEVIIAVVVPVLVLVSGGFLGFFYNRRTKHNKESKEAGDDLLSFDFDVSLSSTNDGTTVRNMEFDLPMFSYSSVSAATNNFSPENKLGEGGFGPVYKGELLNGQKLAVKRLSQKSGQGFEEFRNEILLIAKLQHRNLVRILGCCIDPAESILIYEYMPNKSLDLFLFGPDKQDIVLDWETRIRIVEGIAQGLLYLHEYSRVRIIHRDLKASNILLDDEMNPKISDFGMARIFFGGTDSRAHTNRVVGTFGYIAPEYAMEGLFSIKSDVYSFGVLVLEIISGRKNTGFYKTDCLSLLGYAWDLWISDRGVEVVDDKVGSMVAASTALRYINVGLLCVQENPNERPNMSSVVSMLSSEIAALPPPNKPAFSTANLKTSSSSQTRSGDPYPSASLLTVSDVVPR
ncbi:G-type lectin S-receptor-like serine/threonine-protein kinase At4g03230 [Salvia miltiorrhiza]|uniref:G-type lectin S-receptor-like serine/threonine-protein kinase At4g03230 n=1 Tax=Salvia miltiorrhiza TaxID=226208 RepID=UPI0025AC0AF3|nr:G-type lectin S-receptor-like serine/threonine-protein kinase At4g03230 [Salvia miltiorrhiza]